MQKNFLEQNSKMIKLTFNFVELLQKFTRSIKSQPDLEPPLHSLYSELRTVSGERSGLNLLPLINNDNNTHFHNTVIGNVTDTETSDNKLSLTKLEISTTKPKTNSTAVKKNNNHLGYTYIPSTRSTTTSTVSFMATNSTPTAASTTEIAKRQITRMSSISSTPSSTSKSDELSLEGLLLPGSNDRVQIIRSISTVYEPSIINGSAINFELDRRLLEGIEFHSLPQRSDRSGMRKTSPMTVSREISETSTVSSKSAEVIKNVNQIINGNKNERFNSSGVARKR